MHAALARAHCEKRRTYHVPRTTYHVPRTTYHVPRTTYHVRTYASSTVSRHFGAETKSSLTEAVVYPTLVRKAIPAAAQYKYLKKSPLEALVIILG